MKAAVWMRRIPWWIPLAAAGLMAAWAAGAGAVRGFRRRRAALSCGNKWSGPPWAWRPCWQRRCPATGGFATGATRSSPWRSCCWLAVYLFRPVNGAHRWLRWGHVGLQPSEFAKLAFVLALGRYLMYRENYRRLRGLLVPLALTTLPVLLVLKEPDLGTASVFLPVLFVMLLVAGRPAGRLAARAAGGRGALAAVLDADEPLSEIADQGALESARRRAKALGRRLPVVPGPQDDGPGRTLGKLLLGGPRDATRHGRLPPAGGPHRFHLLRAGRTLRPAGPGLGAAALRTARLASGRGGDGRRANRSAGCWPRAWRPCWPCKC